MKVNKLNKEMLETYSFNDLTIEAMQVAIYVACGGGRIGRMYAEQPLSAYVDMRVGKLPYPIKAIENMKDVLIIMAKKKGLNPNALPPMPMLPNCGVF